MKPTFDDQSSGKNPQKNKGFENQGSEAKNFNNRLKPIKTPRDTQKDPSNTKTPTGTGTPRSGRGSETSTNEGERKTPQTPTTPFGSEQRKETKAKDEQKVGVEQKREEKREVARKYQQQVESPDVHPYVPVLQLQMFQAVLPPRLLLNTELKYGNAVTSLLFFGLSSLVIRSVLPYVLEILYEMEQEEKEKKRKEALGTFCVRTHLIRSGVKLGEYVVATENCSYLNEQFNLNPPGIEPFMVGQIIAIIDERLHLVMVEVFPNRKYYYKRKINYVSAFVYFEDVEFSLLPMIFKVLEFFLKATKGLKSNKSKTSFLK